MFSCFRRPLLYPVELQALWSNLPAKYRQDGARCQLGGPPIAGPRTPGVRIANNLSPVPALPAGRSGTTIRSLTVGFDNGRGRG
jgi:hypothetical protein